jgi:hypothetical protein
MGQSYDTELQRQRCKNLQYIQQIGQCVFYKNLNLYIVSKIMYICLLQAATLDETILNIHFLTYIQFVNSLLKRLGLWWFWSIKKKKFFLVARVAFVIVAFRNKKIQIICPQKFLYICLCAWFFYEKCWIIISSRKMPLLVTNKRQKILSSRFPKIYSAKNQWKISQKM